MRRKWSTDERELGTEGPGRAADSILGLLVIEMDGERDSVFRKLEEDMGVEGNTCLIDLEMGCYQCEMKLIGYLIAKCMQKKRNIRSPVAWSPFNTL